jgi:methionyl-tRNA formyltransferase
MALRVAFFGTPAFAVPTLEHVLRSSHQVVGVVTQPDRPRGRGQDVTPGPVKAVALAAGVPVLQPERLARDEFEEAFTHLGADIGVVAAYGKILPDWLLAAPRLGLINVHASLLPRFRGASPIHRAVMAGDAETGVTIMRVVKALDAGAMLAAARVPIGPDDTTEDVERVLAVRGAALLVEALDRLERGPVPETPQDEALVTYAAKLTKAEGAVDWSRPAQAVHNQIRGLAPWPRAYAFLDGSRIILHRSRVTDRPAAGTAPGTVVAASAADGLVVACGDGRAIEITDLQLEGRRAMPARELLASRHVEPGARLTAR